MSRDHLLAIDQGTTSTRVVVFDARLRPVGQGQVEGSRPPTLQPGWVEHDPAALIASVESDGGGKPWPGCQARPPTELRRSA